MSPDRLVLGVDGGGTSTVAVLADAQGETLGRGVAGASNPKAVGFEAAFRALESATQEAFAAAGVTPTPVAVACLGLAGFAQVADRERLQAWSERSGLTRSLLPVSDGELVLAAGTPAGWGVAVIAGTGSIAVGANRAGQPARAGGWGYLFGDEGSAYNVTLAALRRCARRADGREPAPPGGDRLTEAFMAALGVTVAAELVAAIHAPAMNRTTIAALAPVVLDSMTLDPSIGPDLLIPAGIDLGVMVQAVARSLAIEAGPLPIALAGGFLLRAEPVRRSLLDHLQAAGYAPEPATVADPVVGAVVLALRALAVG